MGVDIGAAAKLVNLWVHCECLFLVSSAGDFKVGMA